MSVATGADIEALCTKCGDVWHVVVAKVGEEIVRVLCKECGAQHRYKHPNKPPSSARRSSASSAPRSPRPQRVVARFDAPAVAADLSKAVRTYKASERYVVGERVEHPTFGQGVVELLEVGKMTVFFAVGRKVLVCAKGNEAGGGNSGLARPKPFEHKVAGPPPDAVAVGESSDE
jgi:predicted  nucleic acid-binding Zn-ribbon protein